MPTKRIINQNDIDELATYILRKAKYNANINKIIKPFKEELKELMMVNSDYEWFSGKKKAVKLQKVSAPYVDLEKLKAILRTTKSMFLTERSTDLLLHIINLVLRRLRNEKKIY